MHWYRIVDAGANSFLEQLCLQTMAIARPDHVLVEHVLAHWPACWGGQWSVGERQIVCRSDSLSALVSRI
jgi:hypothetical protein